MIGSAGLGQRWAQGRDELLRSAAGLLRAAELLCLEVQLAPQLLDLRTPREGSG